PSWRPAAFAFAAVIPGMLLSSLSTGQASAQPSTGPAAATAPAGKTVTELLIGDAVSGADTPQYKDVTDAVTRAGNGDWQGAKSLLDKARTNNPNKLPPTEILLAKIMILAKQGPSARAQLEEAVKTNPKDPEA